MALYNPIEPLQRVKKAAEELITAIGSEYSLDKLVDLWNKGVEGEASAEVQNAWLRFLQEFNCREFKEYMNAFGAMSTTLLVKYFPQFEVINPYSKNFADVVKYEFFAEQSVEPRINIPPLMVSMVFLNTCLGLMESYYQDLEEKFQTI